MDLYGTRGAAIETLCSEFLQELAAGSTADGVLAEGSHRHYCITVKVMLPHDCFLPPTGHSEGSSAGPFLNTGLLRQATLVPGHPISLAQPFIERHCSLRLLVVLSSCPPVTGVKPTVQREGSPCLLLLPPLSLLQNSSCQQISCTANPI